MIILACILYLPFVYSSMRSMIMVQYWNGGCGGGWPGCRRACTCLRRLCVLRPRGGRYRVKREEMVLGDRGRTIH